MMNFNVDELLRIAEEAKTEWKDLTMPHSEKKY